MLERVLDYAAVYFGSMFKFLLGPTTGTLNDLSVWETALFTALGMFTTVFLVSLLKDEWRHQLVWKFKRDKRLFTRKNRRLVRIWSRFGMQGIAFLTPILLMPIGGAIIALSFGGSRTKMYKYMAFSFVFWSLVGSLAFHYLGGVFVAIAH